MTDPDVVTALLRVDASDREWRKQGKTYQRATELLVEFPVLSGDGAWRLAEKGRAH